MKAKKLHSLLCLFLLSMLCTSTACSDTDTQIGGEPEIPTTTAAAPTTEEATSKISREDTLDSLPELDFEGAVVKIAARNGAKDMYMEEDTGDILSTALHARNREVEERLNVTLEFTCYEDAAKTGRVMQSVMAGDDTYAIISADVKSIISYAFDGFFVNLNDTEYIDLSQPWWYDDVNSAMSFDKDNTPLIFGEFRSITEVGSIFFNKDLYRSLNLDVENIYDTVKTGKWTMDVMTQICKNTTSDLDGNGTLEGGVDRLGMMCWNVAFYYYFALTQGEEWVTYDDTKRPVINSFSEHTVDVFDGIYNLFAANGGSEAALNSDVTKIFANGSVLFFPGKLNYFSYLRDADIDIGVIPYPKLDETQESYASFIGGDVAVTGIPVSCQNTALASAVLEAMASGGYRSVTTTDIDGVFKGKYSRDEETVEMIDLILNTSKAELLVMIGLSGNPWYSDIGKICQNGSGEIASTYAAGLSGWQAFLDNLYEKTLALS